jgi:cysteine desulfurase
MLPYFTAQFGNAASASHAYGWTAAAAVDQARQQVAALIGAEAGEIVFTSGATEAVNLAIKGVAERYISKGQHIITCETEHKAVLDVCTHLEKQGWSITRLGMQTDGLVDEMALQQALRPDTVLVALMYANNETGVCHPIARLAAMAKAQGALFFCDATQALGKVPVQVTEGVDLMAFSAHKLYGPKGAGGLYVRRKNPRVSLIAQMDGGGHEKGMRSGTLNVPGIVGLGAACALAATEMEVEAQRLNALRNQLEQALLAMEEVYVNGKTLHRLPHVCNVSFAFTEPSALLSAVNKVAAVSSGSACTSASRQPSHVLKAMGLGDDMAAASIRFSLGRFTTGADIEQVISALQTIIPQVRSASATWQLYREGRLGAEELERWQHPDRPQQ